MKKVREDFSKRQIKQHFTGDLRGLGAQQLYRQRGFKGSTFGAANKGKSLGYYARKRIELELKDKGII